MERLDAVFKHLNGDVNSSSDRMLMNTEWGSFDNKLSVYQLLRMTRRLTGQCQPRKPDV